jgi:hypothetical protein
MMLHDFGLRPILATPLQQELHARQVFILELFDIGKKNCPKCRYTRPML